MFRFHTYDIYKYVGDDPDLIGAIAVNLRYDRFGAFRVRGELRFVHEGRSYIPVGKDLRYVYLSTFLSEWALTSY